MSGGPCAQFWCLKPKQKVTHDFVDFVWFFGIFNIKVMISLRFLVMSKKTALVNNDGFVGLGPGNAGETRVVGHDPRNLQAKELEHTVLMALNFFLGPLFLARNNYKQCFCKI